MSFFSKGKEVEVVLFSPLEGQLTYNGEPAAGAKLELWIAWKDQVGEKSIYKADEKGRFKIPVQTAQHRDNPLVQLSVGQRVTVTFKDQEFVIWEAGKSNGDLFGELGGKPVNLTCELTNELDDHLDHALLGTSCKWENLEKNND